MTRPTNQDLVENPRSLAAGGGHIRLLGDLAATTAVLASTNPEERICVAGYKTVKAVGKFSSVTANCVLALHPIAVIDGTRITAGAPSTVNITAAGQFEIAYALEGEMFVEVEVQAASGKACTIDWLDVAGTVN